MNRLLVLLLLLLLMSATPVRADDGALFWQGRTQLAVVAGNAYAFDQNYLVIGASASYYLLDGLGVGLAIESWSGGNPRIAKIAPFAQYVFFQEYVVQPYVGGFYRHTYISGSPSVASVGARTGIFIASGPNSSVGIGLVHESYLDCRTTIYRACSETYPDISFTFGF